MVLGIEMLDVIKPHNVSLCVLLRAFLDSDALEVCHVVSELFICLQFITLWLWQDIVSDIEGFQSLGDFLLLEIRARNTVKYPSLSQLLFKLQVQTHA